MQYVNLGRSGLKVSRLCLGAMSYGNPQAKPWILSEEQGRPILRRALELGINFFDTADMYSGGDSERVLGRALRDFARREEVVVATKAYYPTGAGPNQRGLSRKHLLHAIDASLARLGMDYVDLYQVHRWDDDTPLEETLEALHDIVRSGKARYIGASSMYAWQFQKALMTSERHGWTRFVSMQNHYNLAYREEEREMLPLCRDAGVAVLPWSPLARGFLARKRDEADTKRAQSDAFAQGLYYSEDDYRVVDAVAQVAAERGVTQAKIALAWLLDRAEVTAPIIGATRMEHLEQSVETLALKIAPEERPRLEAPYRPHRVLGHE
ncbi:aldo/keto reductase [Dyella sp. LX-66]|uniref:aldo/keto reductase n=1 Tax=unclassified Dyella TaxID=2634549 RepID=UPI001BE0FCAC|nr:MULTISPECIES: aldo/keto reductase [unclassified Dyella]MBT2118011.1 aldo/keto reductase [Dyella sp. LX-1]MBT2140918.1 aldo/keto reductase [Dyella sp. LX-66]